MAVALDAVGSGTSGTSGTTTITWSHTVSGANRVLVVFLGSTVGAAAPTSITYGGVSMTQFGSTAASSGATTDQQISTWTLVAPATGTANVVVTFPFNTSASGGSLSLTGADQSTPLGTAVVSSGSSASGSVTVSSAATGLVLSGLSAVSSSAPTATGTSQTSDFGSTSGLSTPRYTAGSHQPGAASVTASWSWGTSNGFVIVGLNAYAVGTAPGVARPRPAINVVRGAVRRASVI